VPEIDPHLASSLSRRFRLVRLLGAGGMGAVYLAEQIAVGNRPVALKVLSRKLLDDPDFLLRFQNEAASTGRIHHANVVTIYESGQADDGTPYIAMEFLEGESLREALARRGALPVPEVAEILQQAARGLNAAHKLGIIHRDLKPDNIFLTYPDEDAVAPVSPPAPNVSPPPNIHVKIVDFGIAKLRESATQTQTGTLLGTPAYMSFEQASGMRSDELDARSDVYSLGVVVYEMLTCRLPFQSATPVGYLRMHMQEAPPSFRTVKPDLPALPQLESVVMKALTKDRDQRYGSVLEFARDFAQATTCVFEPAAPHEAVKPQPRAEFSPVPQTIVPAAAPPSGPTSTVQVQSVEAHHSKLPWLLGALGFVLIIAVASFWFPRGSKAPGNEPKNPSKPAQNRVTEVGAGRKTASGQSPTDASRLPPKPASQPQDAKAQVFEKHFLKGYALFSTNDLNGAIAEYREAIRLKPDHAGAHYELGLALGDKGDLNAAIAEHREAIRLNPDLAEAHYELGEVLYQKEDFSGALAEYREAVRLKPDDAAAHMGLGLALDDKGDVDGAIGEYHEGIRLKPDNADAHFYLGLALREKGDLDAAIAEFREGVRLKPNDGHGHGAPAHDHVVLGEALDQKRDFDGAISEFREAIRLKPDFAEAHESLGISLSLKGDWDGMITEEREAIRLKPDNAEMHDNLGAGLEQKGELQAALQEYRKAYELAPNNQAIRGDYERLVKRLNP
jgi:serine/threonine protein kinase/cytochrome c-type biogenesis protein CcmH/NrfG